MTAPFHPVESTAWQYLMQSKGLIRRADKIPGAVNHFHRQGHAGTSLQQRRCQETIMKKIMGFLHGHA